ncbi:MAG: OsmC family protein [Gammaproteobacteria bacterium]|nr:OsmC family protein [Gammaproteobacteria bacterium]
MAIKMKTVVKLSQSATCPSHSRADIKVRDVGFSIDEPTERGGTNSGPTPTDTAIAALVGCTNVIAHKCAAAAKIDIGHLNIDAVCDFDRRGVTLSEEIDVPFQHINLTISWDGPASAEDIETVAAEVKKYCPLSKLFRAAGTTIDEEWTQVSPRSS